MNELLSPQNVIVITNVENDSVHVFGDLRALTDYCEFLPDDMKIHLTDIRDDIEAGADRTKCGPWLGRVSRVRSSGIWR